MPYRWTTTDDTQTLTLWPHQSMRPRDFAVFIAGTAFMALMPLLAVLGSPVLWVLLGFFVAAVAAVWWAIMRNKSDRRIREDLTVTADQARLIHRPARGAALEWSANPYWVRVEMRADGPVENYLTLKGGDRLVEIGAFLTADERADLHGELNRAFSLAKGGSALKD